MTKKKSKKKNLESRIFKRFNMKFGLKDFKIIQSKADKYTGGNVSEYLKATALRYVPKRGEKFRKIAAYRKRV